MSQYKLTIELVPETSWFVNLRSILSPSEWDAIRKKVYWKAGYRCEICGGKGPKWPVEAHEEWEYDDNTRVQKLVRLIALCPTCHSVKHIGLTTMKGNQEKAIAKLMEVNNINRKEAENLIKASLLQWKKRSTHEWMVDTSYLQEYLAAECEQHANV